MNRREELAANLADVQQAIADVCRTLNRELPTLIVVTKTKPVSDVDILASLGVTDVGENRDQDAGPKRDACLSPELTWHAIGQLQTNKAKSVAQWADVVHSVDRPDLVKALGKATVSRTTALSVLIQVNLDDQPQEHRGGCLPNDVLALAAQIAQISSLDIRGVMGVAPLGGDPADAFRRLAKVHNELMRVYPGATWMSAGMSDDYVPALENGATHLRIGSSILGERASRG